MKFDLFTASYSLTPSVSETKFRNFERKIAAMREQGIGCFQEVSAFIDRDGINPSPRGRQPFRISEFEKAKIGFYAQFFKRTFIAEKFQVCTLSVKRYEQDYRFPVVSG